MLVNRFPCIAAVALLQACEAPIHNDQATIADSAGVLLISPSDVRSPISWIVSDVPVLRLDATDQGIELYRVTGALRLAHNRYAVANSGSQQVLLFEADGSFLRSVGRRGDGPGEFQEIALLRRYRGDSLAIFDFRSSRITVLGPQGAIGRVVSLRPASPDVPLVSLVDVFADGRFVVQGVDFGFTDGPGVVRRPYTIYTYNPDGTVAATLGVFPGFQFFRGSSPRSFGAVPFGRNTLFRAHGNRLFVGTNDTYEYQVWESDGNLRSIVRLSRQNRTVDDATISEYLVSRRREIAAGPPATRADRLETLHELPFPDTYPAYAGMLIDRDGYVWLEQYRAPAETNNSHLVISSDGRLVGSLQLPAHFRPFDIGADYLLGKQTDEMELEHVVVYGLARRPS
ncbi:MAG: 6-bladed beta-propeller [Gemmatimonadales bacterium]